MLVDSSFFTLHSSFSQFVSHSCALCLEVAAIVFVGLDHDGDVLHDGEAVAFQADTLDGVVRDETNLADAHLTKYLGTNAILAFVGTEAEVYVGIDCVVALLLELVGGYLVHQSYAATFLAEIDDEAFALLLDHAHRLVELLAAIATLAAEDVARHAAGVHAHQHRLVLSPCAFVGSVRRQ